MSSHHNIVKQKRLQRLTMYSINHEYKQSDYFTTVSTLKYNYKCVSNYSKMNVIYFSFAKNFTYVLLHISSHIAIKNSFNSVFNLK